MSRATTESARPAKTKSTGIAAASKPAGKDNARTTLEARGDLQPAKTATVGKNSSATKAPKREVPVNGKASGAVRSVPIESTKLRNGPLADRSSVTKPKLPSGKGAVAGGLRESAKEAVNASVNGVSKRPVRGEAPSRDHQRSPASDHDPIQFREEVASLPKTFLNAKQLAEFKDLLLRKRAQLAGDVMHLTDEALHRRVRGANESSAMPIHMADLGSDNWEQDFTLGLIANEQQVVREIDDALRRISDKTYGMCVATGKRIGVARLRAKPWAKYCIEYARAREEGRAP